MLRDLNRSENGNSAHCNKDTPYEEVEDEYERNIPLSSI